MTPLNRMLAGSAASLLLAASTSSLAGTQPSLQLVCAAGQTDTLCVELAKALGRASGGKPACLVSSTATPSAQLRVEFIQEHRSRDSLSGHLVWTAPDAAQGMGPTLELSIMDADLADTELRRFATQLVEFSNLPL